MLRNWHPALYTLLALALAACSGSNNASDPSVPYPPTPDTDAFYTQPATLPDAPPGTILNSRPISFAPLLGQSRPNAAWQLQFISHDAHGRRIAAIATVVEPTTSSGGTKALLSYQFAEDSLGAGCAPSHGLSGSTADPVLLLEAPFALQGLAQGWVLVSPDHEGPESAYATGRLAGQITLDAIRAALNFAPLGLNPDTPVGLWGYSGGAIATAWAVSLQPGYAPELNIVGAASGGTPADLIGVARNADTNPVTNALFFNLVLSAIEGINRAYPQMVTPILNDEGKAAMEALKDGCLGATSDGSPRPTGHFVDYTTDPDPFSSAGAKTVAPAITLPQSTATPVTDIFVYHSSNDELIPVAGVDAMVDAWCKAGVHLGYYRPASTGHGVFEALAEPAALAYLQGRLSETPADVYPAGTQTCN